MRRTSAFLAATLLVFALFPRNSAAGARKLDLVGSQADRDTVAAALRVMKDQFLITEPTQNYRLSGGEDFYVFDLGGGNSAIGPPSCSGYRATPCRGFVSIREGDLIALPDSANDFVLLREQGCGGKVIKNYYQAVKAGIPFKVLRASVEEVVTVDADPAIVIGTGWHVVPSAGIVMRDYVFCLRGKTYTVPGLTVVLADGRVARFGGIAEVGR